MRSKRRLKRKPLPGETESHSPRDDYIDRVSRWYSQGGIFIKLLDAGFAMLILFAIVSSTSAFEYVGNPVKKDVYSVAH